MTISADLAHLLADSPRIRAPRVTRGRDGRLQRNAAGEWDWMRDLSVAERRQFSTDLLTTDKHAPGPDEVATATGYQYVDTWAQRLIAEWRAMRARPDPAAELTERPEPVYGPVVGPAEVAEIAEVQPSTVYQWRTRGILPPPDMQVSRQDAWWTTTIQGWAAETGRL